MFDITDYNATAVSIKINGIDAGLLHADGRKAMYISQYLKTGENEIEVRACGSFKNLLGPHFTKARGSAWPRMWKTAPAHTPSSSEYDLIDFGLNEHPVVMIS